MLSSVFNKKEKILISTIGTPGYMRGEVEPEFKIIELSKDSCRCNFCNKKFKFNHNRLEHELIWHRL